MLLNSESRIKWLFTCVVSLFMLGCDFRRGPDPDIPLVGHYYLGAYESVNDNGYFIARGDQVVVSSSIREICILDGKILGRVEDAMVLAMERIENGYFILDAETGKISVGMSRTELEERVGAGASIALMPPRGWKPPNKSW